MHIMNYLATIIRPEMYENAVLPAEISLPVHCQYCCSSIMLPTK